MNVRREGFLEHLKTLFRLQRLATALMVVDMQKAFLDEASFLAVRMGREMLPRLKDFIAAFRALHIPVIYTRAVCMADGSDLGALSSLFPEIRGRSPFQEGSIGVEICEDLRPEPDDYVISHRRFNAFYGTDLEIILRAKGIDTLIFAGVNTNMSVESTAREAFCRDFRVVIASDLTGATPSRDGTMTAEQVHEAALRMFDGLFGYVLSSDEIMTKLLPA